MIEMDGIDEDVAFSRSIPQMRRNLLSDICRASANRVIKIP